MGRGRTALLAASLIVSGCATAPPYVRPAIDPGAAYKEVGPWQPAGANVPPAGKWWELFGDPVLSGLAERIEAGNPALAVASARYAQAAALVGRTRADRGPDVNAAAQVGRTRVSAGRPGSAGRASTYDTYAIGPSLSYEVDLFDRVRNRVTVSEAGAAAAWFDIAAVRLGLQAQLAGIYFDLRGFDARTTLLRETVSAYQRAFDLTRTRHEGGIASGIDVSRAETQLASARAELEAVTGARARAEHAIATLVGEVPSRFTIAPLDAPLATPDVPVSVPSTVLERRPDIAAAERRVAAANARIGVARSALFPTVTLGGTFGFLTTRGALFDVANSYWALGPLAAALSIFDNGARKADVAITRAEYEETVAGYRDTVLNAFREVEDVLATARQLQGEERNIRDAARAAGRTRDLALTRYRQGASGYLDVVIAQTAALNAERALLDLHAQQLGVVTDLVRALGGLYDRAPAPDPAVPAQSQVATGSH